MGINAFSVGICLAISVCQQWCEIERWFRRTTYRKLHVRSLVFTWRHVTPKGKGCVTRKSLTLNISKTVWDRRLLQIDHISKAYITKPMVTWPMMSVVANGDQGWHDIIYRWYISDIYPIFSSSKISDIFDIFKIGYFPYFFNITLLLDVKTSLKCENRHFKFSILLII